MEYLYVGIGLVFVVEGLLWALFPRAGVTLLEAAKEMPETNLRVIGTLSVCLGFLIVWLTIG